MTNVASQWLQTTVLTILALMAFAANSVLCRLALENQLIDPSSFTFVRLVSGIAVLALVVRFRHGPRNQATGAKWSTSLMLFVYAITFSLAYITLDTGTGALILFGSLQVTVVAVTMWSGARLSISEWIGLMLALIGFAYLMLPGASAPPIGGFLLMVCAGASTAIYTLAGRHSTQPLRDTYFNFLRTAPMLILLLVPIFMDGNVSSEGVLYAVISGSVTSGLGYAVWYSALRDLSAMQAGVLQLLVPVIAAVGGVIFVSEPLAPRLPVSSLLILGGIAVLMLTRNRSPQNDAVS